MSVSVHSGGFRDLQILNRGAFEAFASGSTSRPFLAYLYLGSSTDTERYDAHVWRAAITPRG